MAERQVDPPGAAGRRPDGRGPHQPGQDRAAPARPWTWPRSCDEAVETSRPADRRPRGHRLTVALPDEPVRLEADPTRLEQVLCEPAEQRRQVHRAGRADRAGGASGRAARSSSGCGTRASASPPRCCPRLRDVRPGRARARSRSQGGLGIGLAWCGAWSRCTAGAIDGAQRRAGPGQRVRRAPARPARQPPEPAPPARRPADAGDRAAPPPRSWSWTTTWTPPTAWPCSCGCYGAGGAGRPRRARRPWRSPRSSGPEVVLLDIGLPGMDGYEVGPAAAGAARVRGRRCWWR